MVDIIEGFLLDSFVELCFFKWLIGELDLEVIFWFEINLERGCFLLLVNLEFFVRDGFDVFGLFGDVFLFLGGVFFFLIEVMDFFFLGIFVLFFEKKIIK